MSPLLDELQGLLQRVSRAFYVSDVHQLARAKDSRWNYSLITGACRTRSPLIVGFNWGASAGAQYDPQRVIEPSQWSRDDLGSFVRILPYIAGYLPNLSLETASQTNYCFFRSKEESEISSKDLELCWPVFTELLALMDPTVVLSFSARLRDYLLRTGQVVDTATVEVKQQRGACIVMSLAMVGKLEGGVPVAFLPHPNYPLRRSARERLWELCAKWLAESS